MKARFLAALLASAPGLAHADAVGDALSAAVAAYEAGDLNRAAAQIITAQKEIAAIQAARLKAFLPEAPEGFTRHVADDDPAAAAMMMGMVGTMVTATYTAADGAGFTLTLTSDSPLAASMAGILGNPQMMAMMGRVVKVGGLDMLDQQGTVSGLVGGRVLVQVSGMESAAMMPVLEAIDYAGLAAYDR